MSERPLSALRGSERLAERRKKFRRRLSVALLVLFSIAAGAAVYGLWQEPVRIKHVEIFGGDPSLVSYAERALVGTYFGIIPHNSTFFFPESRIRGEILSEHPEIAAVSVFRNKTDGLTLKIDYRAAVGKWCGLAPTSGVDEYCYVFDSNGFIFSPAGSSTPAINAAVLYAPLAGDTEEPLRATLTDADKLPSAFDFARQLGTLDASVLAIVLRDSETDLLLSSGTRITYFLGEEQKAFTGIASARGNLNLSDGSIEYVDARFDSKLYVKRRGE